MIVHSSLLYSGQGDDPNQLPELTMKSKLGEILTHPHGIKEKGGNWYYGRAPVHLINALVDRHNKFVTEE